MNEIKISVDLNVQLSENTKEFINKAIATLLGASTSPVKTPKTEKPAPAPAPAPAQATAAPAQATAAPKTEKPAPAPTAKAELTINDVRSIVASKAATHRNEIKSKLVELGAQNVTTLDPSNYQVFVDYLKSLN